MNAPAAWEERVEPKPNVYQRLSNARAEFHTLKLKKSGHNKFAGYNYFELSDFLIPAMDVFRKHGIVGIVSFHADSACLVITNLDEPRDTTTIFTPMSSAALKGCHEVQNLGAVQTYLRRYLWVAALEIVEHDAIDSSKPVEEKPVKQSSKSIAKAELEELGEEEQQFLQGLAMEVLSNLPDEAKLFDAYKEATKGLDTDEKTAFWSFFDSKSRAAIKRQGQLELAGAM